MARKRTIPDPEILATVRRLLAEGGDKAVSFGTVSRATMLAPSTLAQRYGSVVAMRNAALLDGWRALSEATSAAMESAADKGPQGLLKALDAVVAPAAMLLAASTGEETRSQAQDWRRMVEAAVALRLGNGEKAREGAAILFATWQGQLLWGAEGFRLKDAVKRLG